MGSDPRVEKLRHALQEMSTSGRELAPHLNAYKIVLEEVGFSKDQAFALVRDFHGHILAGVREGLTKEGRNGSSWNS